MFSVRDWLGGVEVVVRRSRTRNLVSLNVIVIHDFQI